MSKNLDVCTERVDLLKFSKHKTLRRLWAQLYVTGGRAGYVDLIRPDGKLLIPR